MELRYIWHMVKLTSVIILIYTNAFSTNVHTLKDSKNYIYIVKKGDTMSSIAKKVYHDGDLWRTMAQNNKTIANPHRIYPGESICLPKLKKVHLVVDSFKKYRPYFGILTSTSFATMNNVTTDATEHHPIVGPILHTGKTKSFAFSKSVSPVLLIGINRKGKRISLGLETKIYSSISPSSTTTRFTEIFKGEEIATSEPFHSTLELILWFLWHLLQILGYIDNGN